MNDNPTELGFAMNMKARSTGSLHRKLSLESIVRLGALHSLPHKV